MQMAMLSDNGKQGVPTIGGRLPINSKWAGKTHPSGISFDKQGFPKFEPHAEATFKADNLTGNVRKDFKLANDHYGFDKTPEGFTWHHHQDGKTLQLVPQNLHSACKHTGGCAVIKNGGSLD